MSSRVLLVDDDALVRRSTQQLLERSGHQVESFNSGDELLDRGVSNDAEIILLDMRLPGRSGLDVLRELNRGGNKVPVIMITAHADVSRAVEAMKQDVLSGMAAGESNKAIANRLGISVRTVETYRAQLLNRLGLKSAAEAIRLAAIARMPRPLATHGAGH